MTGTDLEAVRSTASITKRLRADYDPHQIELIRHTVASDCDEGELMMFLEVCARYELDPFSKQIWAAKIQNRLQIIVSRDGLVALANRAPDFRGLDADCVRKHDYFRKHRENNVTIVEHEYRDEQGEPTGDTEARGEIVGSWALVHRADHPPTYFFASWEEYGVEKASSDRKSPWKTHPSAMIIKCAETNALRKAFSISGVVGEEEVAKLRVRNLTEVAGDSPADIDWGDDEDLAELLRNAFEELGYTRRKVRLSLRGKDDDGRRELLRELLAEIEQQAEQDAAAAETGIEDATVVES